METVKTWLSWSLCGYLSWFIIAGLMVLGGCTMEQPRTFSAMINKHGMPRTIECIGEPPCLSLPMTIIRQDHPSYDHYMHLVEELDRKPLGWPTQ